VVLYTNPREVQVMRTEFWQLDSWLSTTYSRIWCQRRCSGAKGYVDPNQLFVTGGSGGGVLTAGSWEKNNSIQSNSENHKPVINGRVFCASCW
jgi:hypothetical protein